MDVGEYLTLFKCKLGCICVNGVNGHDDGLSGKLEWRHNKSPIMAYVFRFHSKAKPPPKKSTHFMMTKEITKNGRVRPFLGAFTSLQRLL